MTNEEKTPGSNRLEELTQELAKKLKDTMVDFAKIVSEELGGEYQAGVLPYLRSMAEGAFKPDARVVILPVKQPENGTKEVDTGASDESKTATGSEEPVEAPVTTG